MALSPFILPRETRESTILTGNGTAGPFGPSLYRIFDEVDVRVFAKAEDVVAFSDVTDAVTITKTAGEAFDTFSVTFDAAVPETTEWYHAAMRVAERSVAVTRAGAIDAPQLEKELSKQASAQSELRRDVSRAWRGLPGTVGGAIVVGAAGALLMFDAFGNIVEASIGASDVSNIAVLAQQVKTNAEQVAADRVATEAARAAAVAASAEAQGLIAGVAPGSTTPFSIGGGVQSIQLTAGLQPSDVGLFVNGQKLPAHYYTISAGGLLQPVAGYTFPLASAEVVINPTYNVVVRSLAAANVSYTLSGTAALARTLADRLDSMASPLDYEAGTEFQFWWDGPTYSWEPATQSRKAWKMLGRVAGGSAFRDATGTAYGTETWLGRHQDNGGFGYNWLERSAQWQVLHDRGGAAFVAASRTSDKAGRIGHTTIAGSFIAWANDGSSGCEAVYIEARNSVAAYNAGKGAVGIELDVANLATYVAVNPYNAAPGRSVSGILLAPGGDITGGGSTTPVSAGIVFNPNAAVFGKGIVFNASALLDVGDGKTISIALPYKSAIQIYSSSSEGSTVGEIRGDNVTHANMTKLIFAANGLEFRAIKADDSEIVMLRVRSVPLAVNYVDFYAAATGGNPAFALGGTDANAGIDIFTKGAGTSALRDSGLVRRVSVSTAGTAFNGATPKLKTGWGVPTGTLTRSTFATSTVTLSDLAERVAALIRDLHGGSDIGLGLLST